MENFDNGAEGAAYHDTTSGSHGQDYDQPPSYPVPPFRQPTDVDIYKYTGYSNGYLLMGQAGEWVNYTVSVANTGVYTMDARVAWGAAAGSLGTFHVEVDGVDKTGPMQIPDSNWSLTTITKTGIQLTAGVHVLRLVWDINAGNGSVGDIDYLSFQTASGQSPYTGTSLPIPGTVETEYFDNGGEGVAYHDTTAGTHGQDYNNPPNFPPPAFRTTSDVDIYAHSGYSNGYLIVMQSGDWMKYAVKITQSGTYTMQARVVWGGATGGTFHVEVDGVDKTGPMQIPNTNWQFATLTKTGVQLSAGAHMLRIVADSNGANGFTGDIDNLVFTLESGSAPPSNIHWLVTDQLGTPRMVVDKSGALVNVKRHDYLPFGEEVPSEFRNGVAGYPANDTIRQKFTQYEHDVETELDFAQARYYSNRQGRFTSPDEFSGGPHDIASFAEKASINPVFYSDLTQPQSLNKYQYCYNNPLRYVDPSGHEILFVYVGPASYNRFGHAAIKHVDDKTGEVTYYDAAYDKQGGKDIIINTYTEKEFHQRYADRGLEEVHVDVPDEQGSLKYVEATRGKVWDYNAVTNNCVSFASYVIEKGGGKVVSDGSYGENPRRYPRDARDGYKKENKRKREEKGKTNKSSFISPDGFDFPSYFRPTMYEPERMLQ